MNVCAKATEGCKLACLFTAGRGQFAKIRAQRIAKTVFLYENRALFLDCLRWDIGMIVKRAAKLGFKPCVRFNGTSDIASIAAMMAKEFPTVMLYDYTKLSRPELRLRDNYSLTFSYSGENLAESLRVMNLGVNVSVVFQVKKGAPLPATWNGYLVIDGDLHDLRFLDRKGVVVGLRAKGAPKNKLPLLSCLHKARLIDKLEKTGHENDDEIGSEGLPLGAATESGPVPHGSENGARLQALCGQGNGVDPRRRKNGESGKVRAYGLDGGGEGACLNPPNPSLTTSGMATG